MSATQKLAKPQARSQRSRKAPASDVAAAPLRLEADEATASDPTSRYRQVTDAAAALAGVEGAALLIATPTGRLRVLAAAGISPVPQDEVIGRDGEALTSAVHVPVTLYGGDLGIIAAWPGEPGAGEEVPGALRKLAEIAAPAMAAGRLAAQDMHLVEIHSIVEVGQVLTGLLDMEDVLSYVVYLAESLVGGHNTTVALLTEDGSGLQLRNSTGSLRASEGRLIPIEGSLMGWVVKTGEATTTASLADDPRGYPWEDRYGPSVVVPLTSNGRIIGTFMVTRVEGSPLFGDESVAILRTMSSYATIAITNAEIHRQQQEVASQLRAQAAELEKAYGELSRSQEQLLISEKMAALGRVTAGIAHEINSPLAGILNSLRTARSFVEEYRTSVGDPEITAEDHQGIADDILNALSVADRAVNKVAQFVKTIKGQTRVGDGQNSVFDPAAEVDSAVSLLQHELRRRRVAVYTEMERGCSVSGDQSKFGLVIQNLLSNALDAFQNKPGEIWVRVASDESHVRIAVEDKGCGIPEEIRGRIFDYLFTTKDVGKGTGLGLAMVHSVVTSDFRGSIALESEVGVGTTFTLTLPLQPAGSEHGS
jgi:signal transduction histidine kinase